MAHLELRGCFDPSFTGAAEQWAQRNGSSDSGIQTDYFRTELRYVDPSSYGKLNQKVISEQGWAPKLSTAKYNSVTLAPLDFVYMDVGCWAGHGGKGNWPAHREFGVVYGHMVVLCAYAKSRGDYDRYLNPPTWKKFGSAAQSKAIDVTIVQHPDWSVVKAFLRRISQESAIGDLYILGATMVSSVFSPVPPRGPAKPIMVFLGDLHAPVMTDQSKAHLIENGQEMLRGRLDLTNRTGGALNYLAGNALNQLSTRAAELTAEICGEMKWERTATRVSVDDWMRHYHVGTSRTADIFQDAGKDLRTFVDALADFHRTTRPLELVQLGDLFDLWLGFQRAFGDREGSLDAVDNLRKDLALPFARFWVDQSLYESDQGPHLVHLLTLSQHAGRNAKTGTPLNTYFLYGNHDNYRKHGVADAVKLPEGHEHAGLGISAFRAPSFFQRTGLWAEHGHQPDEANRDEDPSRGHELTQAAFIDPSVRSLEGPAGWLASQVTKDDIPRVTSIRHALDKCLLNHLPPDPELSTSSPSKPGRPKPRPIEPCRGIYVMGHSHEPMLKRVELWPSPPPKHS